MGIAKPELIDQVVKVVHRHVSGDCMPSVKLSRKGNFQSVSITITATNTEQIERIYEELASLKLVRIVL